jgi:hypothetical protein
MGMAESKRRSRAAPARAAHAEATEAVMPDETTGLSLLVAAGSLAAFILLGSAPPHEQGAIEVTEQAHGAVVATAERSADLDAPARAESDAPTVKLNELEVEDSPPPEPEGVPVEANQPAEAAPQPAADRVAVPKIELEEEPAVAAPAAPPPSPPAAPAVPAPKPAASAPPAAPAPKAPVAAAPAPAAPAPATPSEPAKPPANPEAPAAPKAPSLPPAPTLAPPVSNPY